MPVCSAARVDVLVLWDIDGTLLTTDGLGRELYAEALQRVTGGRLEWMPAMAGRTDRQLTEDVLVAHGVPASKQTLDAFLQALAAAADCRRTELPGRGSALPGADTALTALAGRAGLVQSVVTGNIRPLAELKLSSFGLARQLDFEVGGYGSDHSDRAVLVRRSVARAAAKYGAAVAGRQVVVVGDTVHDIAGAVDNGVVAVGVASGATSAAELAAAGADVVLPSLADPAAVLAAVLGR